MKKILILDDDDMAREFITDALENEGFDMDTADSIAVAERLCQDNTYNCIVSDILLADGNGLQFLANIRKQNAATSFVVITAYATESLHEDSFDLNVSSFITKPFTKNQLKFSILTALKKNQLHDDTQNHAPPTKDDEFIIGNSPAIHEVIEKIDTAASSDLPIIICGETGTGKELVAKSIHKKSHRKDKPLLSINCAAIPEQLVESHFFGHVKGAFTGAVMNRIGVIEAADQGTLFLDELEALPLNIQAKLLRVLESGEFVKVGEHQIRKSHFRIITATNTDVTSLLEDGSLRSDLYYRLKGMEIQVPELSERRDDIPLLVHHFLRGVRKTGIPDTISNEAMLLLVNKEWRGNVRELKQTVQCIAWEAKGQRRIGKNLVSKILNMTNDYRPSTIPYHIQKEILLTNFTRQYLQDLLMRCYGNVTLASKISGIDRSYILKKTKEFKINPADFRSQGAKA